MLQQPCSQLIESPTSPKSHTHTHFMHTFSVFCFRPCVFDCSCAVGELRLFLGQLGRLQMLLVHLLLESEVVVVVIQTTHQNTFLKQHKLKFGRSAASRAQIRAKHTPIKSVL